MVAGKRLENGEKNGSIVNETAQVRHCFYFKCIDDRFPSFRYPENGNVRAIVRNVVVRHSKARLEAFYSLIDSSRANFMAEKESNGSSFPSRISIAVFALDLLGRVGQPIPNV